MAEYIDREALEVALNHRLNFLMAENGEYDHYTSGFDEAVTRVENFPAADVVEVRHGRWEAWMPDKNGETREFICTGCRFMVEMSWKQKECDYEWCPYCGCKMDKEEADDKKQPEEAPGE